MTRRKKVHPMTSGKQLASGKPVVAPSADDVKARTSKSKPQAPASASVQSNQEPEVKANGTAPLVVAVASTAPVAPEAKKKRRHKHCVTARRLVRKTQKNDQLLLAKAGIHRLVDTCARMKDPSSGDNMRSMHMSRRARDALHSVIEDILSRFAAEANELARVTGRDTVTPFHVLYVFYKWTDKQPGNFLSMFQQSMDLFEPMTKDAEGAPVIQHGSQQYHWLKMMQRIGTKVDVGLGATAAANAGRELPFASLM